MVEKRGRKSSADRAEIGIVPIMPGDAKPPPPADMSKSEADVWRMIVDAMPLRYFGRETWPVLVGLCKHVVVRDAIGVRLDKAIAGEWEGSEVPALLELYNAASRQVRQHSADLRLTKITRISRQVTVDAAKRNQVLRKPWDD